ncbi:MAG: transporter substrate-binding domain-containing protein [Oceanospirillaceae bacterium]
MRKCKFAVLYISIFSSFTLTAFITEVEAQDKVLKLGYADYRPYSYQEKGQVKGVEVDVLNEALYRRMNIPLQHNVLPWKRVQEYVNSGKLDAFVAVASTERDKYAISSQEAVTYGQVSAFFKADSVNLPQTNLLNIKQLLVYDLAVIAGSGWAKKHLPTAKYQSGYSIPALTSMLQNKRVDAVVENTFIFGDYLHNSGKRALFKEIPLENTKLKLVLYISRHSSFIHKLDEFDETLRQLDKEGVLENIYLHYK